MQLSAGLYVAAAAAAGTTTDVVSLEFLRISRAQMYIYKLEFHEHFEYFCKKLTYNRVQEYEPLP